jgi:hypothetical protein
MTADGSTNRRWPLSAALSAGLAALALTSCGGSGIPTASLGTATGATVNFVAMTVDAGPAQQNNVNMPYVSVTLCAPGSNSQCQTIDHVLVDTGSTGFRVLAEALGNGLTSSQLRQVTDSAGNALVECTQYVDGYSWGPVKQADLKLGGETAANIAIQVMGDPAYPSTLIPTACANLPKGEEDTVQQFGANGVLGVGNYLQDCGAFCTQTGVQDGSAYNTCSSTVPISCRPATVPLNQQVSNPVAGFAADNNGVLLQLPAAGNVNMPTLTGTLYFGIGTQANNALGAAGVYALDQSYGTLLTQFAGTQLPSSFIDSGSNGNFFPDSAITTCADQSAFYCPAAPQSLTAQIQGINGTLATIAFAVSNADQIPVADTVAPGLAGPAGSSTSQSFDWGLPFFLGRSVYIAFEGVSIGSTMAPAVAF